MTETTPDLTDPHVILDRMKQIVENDQVIHMCYLSEEVVRPDLAKAGAVCGGHSACAVGSLWLAGDIKPVNDGTGFYLLPGVLPGERGDALVDHPALSAAYDALNDAAEQYAADNDYELFTNRCYEGGLEILFETGKNPDGDEVNPRELLAVIDIAHSILRAT